MSSSTGSDRPEDLLAAQLAATRARITDLSRDVTRIVEATAGANTDDEHDPEGSTIAFERAQLLAVLEQARRDLGALEAARRRVDDGTYGRCERCGRAIPTDRLRARPAATRCVTCAAA